MQAIHLSLRWKVLIWKLFLSLYYFRDGRFHFKRVWTHWKADVRSDTLIFGRENCCITKVILFIHLCLHTATFTIIFIISFANFRTKQFAFGCASTCLQICGTDSKVVSYIIANCFLTTAIASNYSSYSSTTTMWDFFNRIKITFTLWFIAGAKRFAVGVHGAKDTRIKLATIKFSTC